MDCHVQQTQRGECDTPLPNVALSMVWCNINRANYCTQRNVFIVYFNNNYYYYNYM